MNLEQIIEKNQYSQDFSVAIYNVLNWEGGLTNDKDDSGGLTNYGISKLFVEANEKVLKQEGIMIEDNIDEFLFNLDVEKVVQIYHRFFWRPIRADELPYPINVYVFDMAVNMGIHQAIKILQRATNKASDLALVVDGIIGKNTISVVNSVENISYLFLELVSQRVKFYVSISRKGNNIKFLKGWVNRALSYNCLIKT